jgi:hypothetical protein
VIITARTTYRCFIMAIRAKLIVSEYNRKAGDGRSRRLGQQCDPEKQ